MTKVTKFTPKDGINAKAHRKEDKLFRAYKLFDCESKDEVVDLRVYWAGSTCYACVWMRGTEGKRATGSAKAGGWGYDKQEAAVKSAFQAAGVEIEEPYSHHEPTQILHALAAFYGLTNYHIFEAFG